MSSRRILMGEEPRAGADVISRLAVRVIAMREGTRAALARELDEECGRSLLNVGALEVVVVQNRPATDRPGAMFRMESRYYRCEVGEPIRPPRLEEYERSLGLVQVWTTPKVAVAETDRLLLTGTAPAWAAREREVLRLL